MLPESAVYTSGQEISGAEDTISQCEALLEKEIRRFDEARQLYFIAGETKPRQIGEPFLLRHRDSKKGVLLVHGLMAAPEEVREWACFLYSRGYTVYAPRLAGHGTSAVDLSIRHRDDWMASVDRGLAILKSCCTNLVIAGFSTGAGLALYQALQNPHDFDAVISISAPLKFKGFSTRFVELIHAWNRMICRLGVHPLSMTYAPNHPDNPHINYHRCPIQGLVEVKALMKEVYLALPSLKMPALIMQGKNDPKVDGRSGQRLFKRIGHQHAYYREIDFHLHGVIRGSVAQGVFHEVETFLSRIYLTS